MDPVKTESNTKNVKTEENFKTEKDSRKNKTYIRQPRALSRKKTNQNNIIMKTQEKIDPSTQ